MISDMQEIKHDQQIIRKDIRMLKDRFERYLLERNDQNENIPVHWTKENNIQWPLKSKEEYDNLNKLLQNEDIRNDFVRNLKCKLNSFMLHIIEAILLITNFFFRRQQLHLL